MIDHVMLSMREARICWEIAEGWESFSLKTDSMTDSSVEVVSCGSERIKDQFLIIKDKVFLYLSREGTPVIDDHPGPDDVSAAVYRASNQGDLGAGVVQREKGGGEPGRRSQEEGGRRQEHSPEGGS